MNLSASAEAALDAVRSALEDNAGVLWQVTYSTVVEWMAACALAGPDPGRWPSPLQWAPETPRRGSKPGVKRKLRPGEDDAAVRREIQDNKLGSPGSDG